MAQPAIETMKVEPSDLRVLYETALGKQEGYNNVFVLMMSHTSYAEAERYASEEDPTGAGPDDVQQLGMIFPVASTVTLCRELITGVAATIAEAADFDTFSAAVRHALINAARTVHARELAEIGDTHAE